MFLLKTGCFVTPLTFKRIRLNKCLVAALVVLNKHIATIYQRGNSE